jgi:hypothetical protein
MKNNYYGNQHTKRWIWNPFRKYVINPLWKQSRITVFLIAAVFIFILVGHLINSTWLTEEPAQAPETATTTVATSTPTHEREISRDLRELSLPSILQKICKAESAKGHFTNGQVTTNRTMNMGACQIDVPIWTKVATDME